MTRYYTAGPNASWRGVCEVRGDHQGEYNHYEYWPYRSVQSGWLELGTSLRDHIADGSWVPFFVYPESVRLPEGI